MKRLSLITTALFLFCLALPSFASAGTVRLSYSNFFPPTHVQSKLAEQWAKDVEAKTGGKVVVDYYPGGTLTKAKQCYDGVVEGISDIGLSVLAYSRGRFPVMAAVDLPLGYTSGSQATMVANSVYEKYQPREFRDVKVMYFHAHGPGLLFTSKKPVSKLEDLAGEKIRATGNSAALVKALGGSPVAQPMPTAYQSLQKGVVDGSMHPVESNKGWKLAEVVKFGTESQPVAYTTTFFVVMSKDKWAEIDPASQKIITELNKEYAAKHGAAWDAADAAGREFFLSKGGKFVPLAEGEAARWIDKANPVLKKYAETVAKKKVNGGEVVEFIKSQMQKTP